MPPALADKPLREAAPRSAQAAQNEATSAPAAADPNPTGIW
jgi:hypothetical protein